MNYQPVSEADILKQVKEAANLSEEDHYRIDIFWVFLCGMKQLGTNLLEFKVAEAIMTIPHPNVGEERIINKNKTALTNNSSFKRHHFSRYSVALIKKALAALKNLVYLCGEIPSSLCRLCTVCFIRYQITINFVTWLIASL